MAKEKARTLTSSGLFRSSLSAPPLAFRQTSLQRSEWWAGVYRTLPARPHEIRVWLKTAAAVTAKVTASSRRYSQKASGQAGLERVVPGAWPACRRGVHWELATLIDGLQFHRARYSHRAGVSAQCLRLGHLPPSAPDFPGRVAAHDPGPFFNCFHVPMLTTQKLIK